MPPRCAWNEPQTQPRSPLTRTRTEACRLIEKHKVTNFYGVPLQVSCILHLES